MTGVDEPCRCGRYANRHGLPCRGCWDHRADDALVERMLENARGPRHDGLTPLREIGDPAAAPRLRGLLADPSLSVRGAAACSLGWSGDESDVPRLAAVLDEPGDEEWRAVLRVIRTRFGAVMSHEPDDEAVARVARHDLHGVRATALASIAELGGPAAAGALWAEAERPGGRLRLGALCGLAWLRDRRALQPLRDSMPQWLAPERRGAEIAASRNGEAAAVALLRLGDAGDVDRMVDAVLASADRLADDDVASLRRIHGDVQVVQVATARVMPELSAGVDARFNRLLHRLADGGVHHALNTLRHGPPPPPVEPLGPRVVPSRAMRFGVPEPPAGEEPPAKFGGSPDWRDEPAWPLDARGAPMTFHGQLPVPGGRTGYVFVDRAGAVNWEPLADGNALVVQPGPAPSHVRTEARRIGPRYHAWCGERPPRYRRRTRMVPAEPLYVGFEDRADPVTWEFAGDAAPLHDGDENKLGGTPYWWRGDDATPPGDGWRFAFQFEDHRSGHPLNANPGVCYGFVTDDGRGAFLWR